MHVFVSDLHMNDTGDSCAVTDEQLSAFASRVLEIRKGSSEPVTFVLVGDIFDLLRSPKWTSLWNEKESAPWSNMAPNFSNFEGSFAETQAIKIAQDICNRYSNFSERIRKLVDDKRLKTIYVPGNHDFMVQLSPTLRRLMHEFFALSNDPVKPYELSYKNKEASVFAFHGNTADPLNWHRQAEGYWAVGDAVVLMIVNRFPEEACRLLGCAPTTKLGQLLQDIDNVQPLTDLPIWVRWLTDENLTMKTHREKVLKAWKLVVDEFLSLREFEESNAYGSSEYKLLRYALQLSTKFGLAELLNRLGKYVPDSGPNYRRAAEFEAQKNPTFRFILFGHTHKPTLQPLPFAPEDRTYFYVNTGSWRKLVMRKPNSAPISFNAQRVASYFTIDERTTTEAAERYHLYLEWHTS